MEDSIQNADYETENKKMEKMFKIKNKDGHGFLTGESYIPFTACKENNLPFSMDSLKKVLEFKQ
jgi:Ca2+-binding EF-hand superfamily protein